jgi:2-amino-1-hydroxyethylphosphonate dioxygenase (glycine-forming)
MAPSPQATAASLINILTTQGQGDYISEAISQLAHSLQAAHLAQQHNAGDDTIIVALLHNIGRFLPASEVRSIAHEVRNMDTSEGGVGRVGHERIGEEYLLRLGFSKKVAALVGSHVAAKRYLCAVDPAYHDTLSEASKQSLVSQGEPMKGDELREWGANPWCEEMCELRR